MINFPYYKECYQQQQKAVIVNDSQQILKKTGPAFVIWDYVLYISHAFNLKEIH